MSYVIHQGDVLEQLAKLPSESVHCCVTSPPYWGLRDYGVAGQIGLEPTPGEFLAKMVAVFREVRRVLRADGTCWVNMGDSYNGQGARNPNIRENGDLSYRAGGKSIFVGGLKAKDLCGIPWRVAFALQDDGWWLRQDIIWAKPNPMPESVTDRCTKAHEYVFLLTKSARYFYDAEAILEPVSMNTHARLAQNIELQIGSERANGGQKTNGNMKAVGRKLAAAASGTKSNESFSNTVCCLVSRRNKRSVWEIPTQSYSGAHFATYPEALVKPCILAGSPADGVVLDPFSGSGTTGVAALRHGRSYIGIELNPEYVELSHKRIQGDRPLFNMHEASA